MKNHKSKIKKWQIIDLIRSFCIIAILGLHFYSNIPMGNPWVCWLWGRFCINGIYGVYLFFVLSGFLITYVIVNNQPNCFRPDFLKFYVQRSGRIGPLFFLCFLIGILVFLFLPKDSGPYQDYFPGHPKYDFWFWSSIPTFLFNWLLVLRPNWDYSAHWMILWSLSIEEQFYFLYPLALKKLGNKKNLLLAIISIIVIACLWRLIFYFNARDNGFIQSYASPAKFDLIAIGILLFLTFQRYGPLLSRNKSASFFFCITGMALTLLVYFGTRENDRLAEIWVPEALSLGLFGLLLGGLHLPFFESRFLWILSLPGKYCYGCYLLHLSVLYFIRPLLDRINFFSGFILFIAATTLIAAVSYHFFELPVNRLIRKKFG